MAVNDAFVMDAWGKDSTCRKACRCSPTATATSPTRSGLEMDASGFGLGMRRKRFALYAEDGVVKQLSSRRRASSRCRPPNTCSNS